MLRAKLIDKKTASFLEAKETARSRLFYLLPKVHKPPETWTVPHKIPKGRPIVSDVNSESYAVSSFIDFHLAEYATLHPSYVKNTYDFLDKIRNTHVPANAFLVTLDVESLYTNINNEMGLEATRKTLARTPKPIHPYILKLLEICLTGNDFTFNGKRYLQISGTAMGCKWAPHYADITMADWELQGLQNCPKKPLTYLRYLDDIFIIWNHSESDFWDFFRILNSTSVNINLTANISKDSIDFLDVTIYKDENFSETNKLQTKVFSKPTDTHSLLHKTSHHPKHTYSGIVKSQITRFYRISSNPSDFNKSCRTLFSALEKRNYSKRFLRKIKTETVYSLKKFDSQDRDGYGGMRKCNGRRCLLCPLVNETSKFEYKNEHFPIDKQYDCNSTAVIYTIGCRKCPNALYVGQTLNFRNRMKNHKHTIRKNKDQPIGKHFNETNHSENDMIFTIIDSTQENRAQIERTQQCLLRLENKWIHRLDTIKNGLNIADNDGDDSPFPFIIKYSQQGSIIAKFVGEVHEELCKKFPDHIKKSRKFIKAYSRYNNLKNLLVRAELKTSD